MRSVLLFASLTLTPPAAFAQSPAVGTEVSITGCPQRGVEAGCVVIEDAGGETLDITSAEPRVDPDADAEISLTGTVSDKVGICMQGPILDDIEWEATGRACASGGQQ